MGQRWPLPNIIRSISRFPAQPAAFPLTGRRTCTDHRADGLLMSVVDEGGIQESTPCPPHGQTTRHNNHDRNLLSEPARQGKRVRKSGTRPAPKS